MAKMNVEVGEVVEVIPLGGKPRDAHVLAINRVMSKVKDGT